MSAAIRVNGLRVSIGGVEVIHGVDLVAERDATTAVVGESGSGKSLTARALVGILPRRCQVIGQYKLLGATLALDAPERTWRTVRGKNIVWLPQDPFSSLNPLRNCGSQIVAGSRLPEHEHQGQARQLLNDVGLDSNLAEAYPYELSGGMRQRVAIAAALAADPRVLIADEPTTALDAQTQESVLDLLARLRDSRHMTLLLITHDLSIAAERADHLVVFHEGAIVDQGQRDEVIHHARSPYTRQLLHAHASLDTSHPATPGASVVEANGLTKTYPGASVPAINDVSLHVKAGEILGLVGASGSGKSTVARCLVGLEHPDSGTVSYLTSDGKRTGWSRAQAQLVFQDPYQSLNPTMTVRATVSEALRVSGKPSDERDIMTLLNKVGLPAEFIDRKPGTLSGGQCQRVAIARALAPEPKLLVADEAVTALDALIQTQVLETLLDLRRRLGLAMLFISHDLDIVRRISDRIAVMHAGKIIETGPTETVMNHPQQAYVKSLIAAMPKSLED